MKYILHLVHTSAAFDFHHTIPVSDYKSDQKSKGAAIIVEYMQKQIILPLANIAAIEEQP